MITIFIFISHITYKRHFFFAFKKKKYWENQKTTSSFYHIQPIYHQKSLHPKILLHFFCPKKCTIVYKCIHSKIKTCIIVQSILVCSSLCSEFKNMKLSNRYYIYNKFYTHICYLRLSKRQYRENIILLRLRIMTYRFNLQLKYLLHIF